MLPGGYSPRSKGDQQQGQGESCLSRAGRGLPSQPSSQGPPLSHKDNKGRTEALLPHGISEQKAFILPTKGELQRAL